MAVYPWLLTGAMVSLPMTRVRRPGVVAVQNGGGYVWAADDEGSGWVSWELRYRDVSAAEVASLEAFYEDRWGSQLPFVFCDAGMNLFAWSSDLRQEVWIPGGSTTVSGVSEEFGLSGVGGVSLEQAVAVEGGVPLTLSCEVRATAGAANVAIGPASSRVSRAVGTEWRELAWLGSAGAAGLYGIAADGAIEVRKLQLRAVPGVAEYVSSSGRSGVFEEAYFVGSMKKRVVGLDRYEVEVEIESVW